MLSSIRCPQQSVGHVLSITTLGLLLATLVACGDQQKTAPAVQTPTNTTPVTIERIQDPEQIAQGQVLFQQYCASCHGEQGKGRVADWRKRDSNGNFPPPPLNGTAHAWHHPTAQLHKTIKEGGPPELGKMPGFGALISDAEIDAIIAYIQSLWSDEIYRAWYEREQQSLAYQNRKQ
jgi:mono/diheme cytochrome c family protein